ncbi:pilus assembly PilX family protein [Sulfuricella sp.]|uniref:pilus assembly PilX family protein n=1 Tax=Sulfuricella sp. TaxID=2099377 RepID=UPI002BF04CBB|nr:PilX N-terminal domain-containing pilus assembly protein [Sulfuricella sp.]HUX64294.1 PilX N-terminal domain-containing pilus assembly protein [Sulfuricella sp.]
MSRPVPSHAQRGATLVVGLIMLVIITLMVTTAFTLSTTNLKSVGNMQFRNEAVAAGNIAIEKVLGSPFTAAPSAEEILVDINNDGINDYAVSIATPVCVRASVAAPPVLSSVTLVSMSTSYTWNTVWDIDATVAPTSNNPGASGTSVHVHSGVRVLLSQTDKDAVCH